MPNNQPFVWKKCTECGKLKIANLNNFQKSRKSLNAKCRECINKRKREHYKTQHSNKEQFNKLVESFKNTPDDKVWNHCPFRIRVCTTCKNILVANNMNFHKKSSNKIDGLEAKCKKCIAERDKIYNIVNNEERKSYHKQYYQDNKEEFLEKVHQYREDNPDKIKKTKQKYYQNNKEFIIEKNKQYVLEHPEETKSRQQQWRINNPDKLFNNQQSRRIKEESQGSGFSTGQWQEMMYYFNWKCAYSGEDLTKDNRSVDHILALDSGGENEIWNLAPMIKNYNSSKRTQDMETWYRKQNYFSEDRLAKIYEWQAYAKNKWGV